MKMDLGTWLNLSVHFPLLTQSLFCKKKKKNLNFPGGFIPSGLIFMPTSVIL